MTVYCSLWSTSVSQALQFVDCECRRLHVRHESTLLRCSRDRVVDKIQIRAFHQPLVWQHKTQARCQ